MCLRDSSRSVNLISFLARCDSTQLHILPPMVKNGNLIYGVARQMLMIWDTHMFNIAEHELCHCL